MFQRLGRHRQFISGYAYEWVLHYAGNIFYLLFEQVTFPAKCTHVNIAVFDVEPATPVQLGLFDGTDLDSKSLARAADQINDRYGEFTVVPAKMANMDHVIIKRVPFGSVRDI